MITRRRWLSSIANRASGVLCSAMTYLRIRDKVMIQLNLTTEEEQHQKEAEK